MARTKPFARWLARRFPRRTPKAPRSPLGQQAREQIAMQRSRTLGFAAKSAAAGGAVGAAGYGIHRAARGFRGPDPVPWEEEVAETPEGVLWRDESGGTHFAPSLDWLAAANRRNSGDDGELPIFTGGPSEGTKKFDSGAEALTNPWTLLAIGAVIVGVVWVQGRAKK